MLCHACVVRHFPGEEPAASDHVVQDNDENHLGTGRDCYGFCFFCRVGRKIEGALTEIHDVKAGEKMVLGKYSSLCLFRDFVEIFLLNASTCIRPRGKPVGIVK